MGRFLFILIVSAAMLFPASADAHAGFARDPHGSTAAQRRAVSQHATSGGLASRDPVVRAAVVARRYWGAVPCNGQVTVIADRPLAPGMEPTTDGWVTFNSSLGANNLEAPASTYSQCTISLAHWQWPNRTEMDTDWNMFCLTVIHEMGHLLGHPHSLTPGSVMAPVFTSEANVPSICPATRPSGTA
jgi:Matrixin